MSSAAQAQLTTPALAAATVAAVQRALTDAKHTILQVSPDGLQTSFRTRKTMLTWELDGIATITPGPSGSTVVVQLDTAGGRPSALLDGKKNKKAADKLVQQVQAALG